jgi:transcriptional regulator with XRE-family HTH domain
MSVDGQEHATRFGAWRKQRGWTLAEVAALTGLSVTSVAQAERGELELAPPTKVLMARRLRARVDELFEVPEAPDPIEVAG